MENIDRILSDFNQSVDNNLSFEKDINDFARIVSDNLFYQLDKEGTLAEFEGRHFSFKFITKPNSFGKQIFDVKLLDLDDYRRCLKLSIPEYAKKIKVATFEHEAEYNLKDELKSILVLLLFDYYELPLGASDEGQDEIVRI